MKNLLNLGKALNKAEQKNVFGGGRPFTTPGECDAIHGEVPNGCGCNTSSECQANCTYTEFPPQGYNGICGNGPAHY